ncbi:PDR/VanB family oxidoreductase [Amycolatopsis sp. NPDC051903]|uniref:PDR/VanB family oxidoreductase n=1 Tax=Amycolatopsis sp. NPDC051903 TaxID=3363936 RepID=UPI0037BC6B96
MTAPEGTVEVEVAARRVVANGVLEIELRPVDGTPWPGHGPGAHVDVHLPNGLIRQYSLLSASDGAQPAKIAVLKTDDSRGGSRFVHERLRPGHRILVSEPKNTFELGEKDAHAVLIAGGIGVTPLLAMARRLAARGASFEFHYRVRTPDRAAYATELAALVPAGALHVAADSDGSTFTPEDVLRAAGPNATVYVCGPEAFMEYVRKGALAAGIAADAFRVEHFKHEADTEGRPFTLTAARSKVTVRVGATETPAQVLDRAGVFVPTACEQGVCGTCVARVVSGTPDHRDVVLTAAEKASGSVVTLCCSRAATPELVVDL